MRRDSCILDGKDFLIIYFFARGDSSSLAADLILKGLAGPAQSDSVFTPRVDSRKQPMTTVEANCSAKILSRLG